MDRDLNELKMYKYKASLKNGRHIKGEIAAFSEEEAKKELKSRDVYVLKLKNNTPFNARWAKPSDLEKGMFFEKFASQMKTGADFQRILNNLKRDNFSFAMIKMIEGVLVEIKKGQDFGESLNQVGVFGTDVIEIVRAGEESGKLLKVLEDLAELFTEKAAIRKTLRKAAFKPAGMLAFSFLIIIFVIPRMIEPIKGVYKSFNKGQEGSVGQIPAITQVIMDSVDFISGIGGLFVGGVIAGLVFGIKFLYSNNPKFKKNFDFFIIEVPLIGKFQQMLSAYITFLSLDILYKAGVSMSVAFNMISKAQTNESLREDIDAVQEELKAGKSLNRAINQSVYISPLLKDLIIQGDISGTLSDELTKGKEMAKKDFDEYSDVLVKGLVGVVGFIISVIVGVIIIAVYLPIFTMVNDIMSTMK